MTFRIYFCDKFQWLMFKRYPAKMIMMLDVYKYSKEVCNW